MARATSAGGSAFAWRSSRCSRRAGPAGAGTGPVQRRRSWRRGRPTSRRRNKPPAPAPAAAAPRLATGRTALRVLVSALRVELLVVGAERELRATLNTRKGTVFVGQLDDLLSGSRLRSGHRAERLRGEPTRRTLTSSTTLRPREIGAFAAVEGTKHLTHTNTGRQGQQGGQTSPAGAGILTPA